MKFCLRNFFTLFLSQKLFGARGMSKPILSLLLWVARTALTLFLFIELFKHSSKPTISLGFPSYPQLWITLLITYPHFTFKKQRLSYNTK